MTAPITLFNAWMFQFTTSLRRLTFFPYGSYLTGSLFQFTTSLRRLTTPVPNVTAPAPLFQFTTSLRRLTTQRIGIVFFSLFQFTTSLRRLTVMPPLPILTLGVSIHNLLTEVDTGWLPPFFSEFSFNSQPPYGG